MYCFLVAGPNVLLLSDRSFNVLLLSGRSFNVLLLSDMS